MMKSFFLLLSFLAVSATFAQQKSTTADRRFQGLDNELEEVLKTWQAAGFAVAVVEKDKIVYSKGFGYRDYENQVPVTVNTLFAIGSSSKAFTSGLLGNLREEGKLSFDDSPIKYIPELRFHNDEMNNQITIKDIMTHRTGLPRHDLSWYFFSSQSRDSLMQRIAHQEPFAKVREKWYYNNFMFLTQGVIAEKITGKSWEENIQEHFFTPLEMSASSTTIDGLKNGKEASYGYQLKKDSVISKMDYYDIAAMGPAGSINSNVNDMSKWLITWINGGKYKEKEILSEAYVKEAMSPQMIMGNSMPDKEFPDLHLTNYGYGWMISSYKGHYRVEHGGNIDGFSANAAFFPTDSIGIVVLANQNNSAVPGIVRNMISDRLLGVQKTEWNKIQKERFDKAKKDGEEAKASSLSSQKKGTRPSHLLVEYAGDYSHQGYGTLRILLEQDSLFAITKLDTIWLKHYHYDVFALYNKENGKIDTLEESSLKLNFQTNESGEISSFMAKFEPTVEPILFKRKPRAIDLNREELETYAGEYELPGMAVKFYLKSGNDKTLFLLVPGQPEYELLATGKNKFAIRALEGFNLEFIESDTGKFGEVLFIQPNGTFKAIKKSDT